MKVITLINEKGGVGKTTLSFNIAAGLADRGQRVLLIDGDPQGHSTHYAGMRQRAALYNLLVRPEESDGEWKNCIDVVPEQAWKVDSIKSGQLYLVANNIEGRTIPLNMRDVFELDTRIRQLSGKINTVIIDTSPTPSLFHSAVLVATDYTLYPTQLESGSIDGLLKSMGRLQNVNGQRENHNLYPVEIAGIVPIRYRANTLEHKENLTELQKRYGDKVWRPIGDRIMYAESWTAHKAVYKHDPNSQAAFEVYDLLDQLERTIND